MVWKLLYYLALCRFGGGVVVCAAAFFSNVIGLNQAPFIGVHTTCSDNDIGFNPEAPTGAYSHTIYNIDFM